MIRPESSDETAQETQSTDKLTRFANILGATFVGMIVTGILLWVMAGGLQLAGGGIFYVVIFLVATGLGYVVVKEATETLPSLRFVIIAFSLGAVTLVSLNWRHIGFEDPFVAPAIFAIFVMLAYFFMPGKPTEAKSFKSEMEDRLAEYEVVEDTPAMSDATNATDATVATDGEVATVTLYRKSSMAGALVTYYISCDGKPVAKIEDGCRTTVRIPTGNYQLSLTDEHGSTSIAPIALSLKPEEEIFIDCTFRSFWSGVAFKTVDPAQAQRDMVGLNPSRRASCDPVLQ